MTDRPILFSAPMIRALLDGRKSQTRRVLKPQPKHGFTPWQDESNGLWWQSGYGQSGDDVFNVPYAVGDRLWCRETWDTALVYDDLPPSDLSGEEAIGYYADGACETWGWEPKPVDWGKLRPSIFMPRWASRITLTVKDVRVQRVGDITCADAIAEGIPPMANSQTIDCDTPDPRWQFKSLWDSLNAKRGFGWDENPWVAAYSFTVHKGNIDMEKEG